MTQRYVLITLLFRISRLVYYQIFSYDCPKLRNLPKIFLQSFDNAAPVLGAYYVVWLGNVSGLSTAHRTDTARSGDFTGQTTATKQ